MNSVAKKNSNQSQSNHSHARQAQHVRRVNRMNRMNHIGHDGQSVSALQPPTSPRTPLWRAIVGAMVSGLVLMCMMLTSAWPAQAADTITPAPESQYLEYAFNGDTRYVGNVGNLSNGNYTYCMDQPQLTDYSVGNISVLDTSTTARQIAWLIQHYQQASSGSDATTQAAIAVIVHDTYDTSTGADGWQAARSAIMTQYPAVATRVTQLWNEARQNTPISIAVSMAYVDGNRTGTVSVSVRNASGGQVAGTSYSLALSGALTFTNGSSTLTGTSSTSGTTHQWKATGNGASTASVSASFSYPVLNRIESSQDLVTLGGSRSQASDPISFTVRKDFTPSLVTQVGSLVVDSNANVTDTVTVQLTGNANYWPQGVNVVANGWYFDNIAHENVDTPIEPTTGESAAAFLTRLAALGYTPVGYATAEFSAPDQSRTVTATTSATGAVPYTTPETSNYGTWVWAIQLDNQSTTAGEYMVQEFVSPFLETTETNMHRAKVSVESTVSEHSAFLGMSLTDTITVSGFPSDHGEYSGNETLGISADEPYAQVSVWWAGVGDQAESADDSGSDESGESAEGADSTASTENAGDADTSSADTPEIDGGETASDDSSSSADSNDSDNSSDSLDSAETSTVLTDDDYRPSSVDVPEQDAHHVCLGTWNVNAVNGTIRFGGGKTDADGNEVDIIADKPGWYVFVWSFDGDDRVEPASSAYNDAWERVRVRDFMDFAEENELPEISVPELTTQVSDGEIDANEPFYDTAHVTGALDEGSYVTFDAYEPVDSSLDTRTNADVDINELLQNAPKLVDNARTEVNTASTDQTVSSPQARSATAGLVYWKATLWNADGDVLATHELGEPSEITHVLEPEEAVEPTEPTDDVDEAVAPESLALTGSQITSLLIGALLLTLCAAGLLVYRHLQHDAECR